MRIGINAQLLAATPGYRQAGISRYLEGLLSGLSSAIAPDDSVVVWVAANSRRSDPRSFAWRMTRIPGANPPLRILWEQALLPLWAPRERLDVLHAPVNVAPLLAPVPSVVTVHDLAFLRIPAALRANRRRYLGPATRASVRRAARVIAVSESTKRDIVELVGLPPQRVTVIPLAVDPIFQPLPATELAAFRTEHGIARPYLLYVGTLEPRKNVPTLLRAFAQIAPEIPHDLILVGAEGWLTQEMHETLTRLRLTDRVRFTGYDETRQLPGWYGAADLFVFPSLYEGFGLPPLEAMACGTPVITSNVSSLPEVVGDAALTVTPTDVDALAGTMRRVLGDTAFAVDLRRRGLARAAGFSWDHTARETVRVYRQAADRVAR